FKPELTISSSSVALDNIKDELVNRSAWDAFLQDRAGYATDVIVYVDPRSGSAVNIMGAYPLIPGTGFGNHVTLESLSRSIGRPVASVDEDAVGRAVMGFVRSHADVLGIDATQLGRPKATQVTPDLWQVHVPQQVRGIGVRYGRLMASISHGN